MLLFSIAFHPQFANNGYLYLSSSNYPVKDAKTKRDAGNAVQ